MPFLPTPLANISSLGEQEIEKEKRVFVARNLKMGNIEVIGFDLDHTLAIYNLQTFDELCYSIAKQKLVTEKGFPKAILELSYNPNFLIRGLIVDTQTGNILKANQYGYVSEAFHGQKRLKRIVRKQTYSNVTVSFAEKRFESVDTLFALPEISLYAQIVDYFEETAKKTNLDYAKLYKDIRETVDLSHKDGSIKEQVIQNLDKYFIFDPKLALTLEKFRKAGKKLFILTNSEWFYTDAVMNHLLQNKKEEFTHWTEYFNLVFCYSKKPKFFTHGTSLEKVEHKNEKIKPNKIFKGGNAEELEKLIKQNGDKILYFGDHTYGDIMRSKRDLGWRTAMIIYELEHEVSVSRKIETKQREMLEVREQNNKLIEEATSLNQKINHLSSIKENDYRKMEEEDLIEIDKRIGEHLNEFQLKEQEVTQTLVQIRKLEAEIESVYNLNWGLLFKCGNFNSRFGDQVKDFACIYTSRVSNLLAYENGKYFRSPMELMPHEI